MMKWGYIISPTAVGVKYFVPEMGVGARFTARHKLLGIRVTVGDLLSAVTRTTMV